MDIMYPIRWTRQAKGDTIFTYRKAILVLGFDALLSIKVNERDNPFSAAVEIAVLGGIPADIPVGPGEILVTAVLGGSFG